MSLKSELSSDIASQSSTVTPFQYFGAVAENDLAPNAASVFPMFTIGYVTALLPLREMTLQLGNIIKTRKVNISKSYFV